MPTIKSGSKSGWIRDLPEQQDWYWVRNGPLGLPVAVEFFPALMDRRQPMVRYPGKSGFMVAIAEDATPEWLGPISPSDFEQLLRLRKACEALIQRFQREYQELTDGQFGSVEDFPETRAVRDVLGVKGSRK